MLEAEALTWVEGWQNPSERAQIEWLQAAPETAPLPSHFTETKAEAWAAESARSCTRPQVWKEM